MHHTDIYLSFTNSLAPKSQFPWKGSFPGPPGVFLYSSDFTKFLNITVFLSFIYLTYLFVFYWCEIFLISFWSDILCLFKKQSLCLISPPLNGARPTTRSDKAPGNAFGNGLSESFTLAPELPMNWWGIFSHLKVDLLTSEKLGN